MDEDFALDMGQVIMELDENVQEQIQLISEVIGDNTGTIDVPVVILNGFIETLNNLSVAVKSMYELTAVIGDAIQENR